MTQVRENAPRGDGIPETVPPLPADRRRMVASGFVLSQRLQSLPVPPHEPIHGSSRHAMKRRPPKTPAPEVNAAIPATPAPGPSVAAGSALRATFLRSLVDNLDEAVVVLGPQGEVQFVNASAERLYGIAPGG